MSLKIEGANNLCLTIVKALAYEITSQIVKGL